MARAVASRSVTLSKSSNMNICLVHCQFANINEGMLGVGGGMGELNVVCGSYLRVVNKQVFAQ